MAGKRYSNLSQNIADFTAKTAYLSSHLCLDETTLRVKICFWNGNSLCSLTEQVVFSDPFANSKYNRWTNPYLDCKVREIQQNKKLLVQLSKLRYKFVNLKQALIHADLHSGSVMVDHDGSVKVIELNLVFMDSLDIMLVIWLPIKFWVIISRIY
jgi:5-methylthioribose kinase